MQQPTDAPGGELEARRLTLYTCGRGYLVDHLSAHAFLAVRQHFWDIGGTPTEFELRPKRNTQDDPFDEYLIANVFAALPGIGCAKSPGPLISPDMILYRTHEGRAGEFPGGYPGVATMLGIEVKKLERTVQGTVARASGLDYNTTPPCGTVRVYDKREKPLDVRCFYLFACLETTLTGKRIVSALALVDGNVLNADFEFYLSIVGERTKEINLGSYADGANRARPMLIFSNPLGIKDLDRHVTLVSPERELTDRHGSLALTHSLVRNAHGRATPFFCYRLANDVPSGWTVHTLVDPFPTPEREERTQPRGRFKLPFEVRA